MHEEALSPQCTGTLFSNRMKSKRPAVFKATHLLPDANRNPGMGLLGSVRLWVTVTHTVKGGEFTVTEPQAGFLRHGAAGGGGWGLGAGRGRSEQGGWCLGGLRGNQVLRWGQVEVSRVIIGQTATARKERGFRKPPFLPPACSPPSPSSSLQGAAEGRMHQPQRRKDPCHSPPPTLTLNAAALRKQPGQQANMIPRGLFSLALRAQCEGPASISKAKGSSLCNSRQALDWGRGWGPSPRICVRHQLSF